MTVTADVPLAFSAAALSVAALLLAYHERTARRRPWVATVALVVGSGAVVAPFLFVPLIAPTTAAGRTLWEWSAAGGPAVRASYRFDGVAAIGVAVGAAYALAALLGARLTVRRHPLLPAALLTIGLLFIVLAVSEDLVGSTIVLGVLAAATVLAAVAVAPLPATTRLAAYFAVGIEFFVLAALLVSRAGGASFRFEAILPTAVSPGVVLICAMGAALFAGLYPFVPWRYERARTRGAEREPLRGIVAMPAGVGATLVLLRLIGVTRTDVTSIALPQLPTELRVALLVAIAAAAAAALIGQRILPRRPIAIAGTIAAVVVAYPALHWSHIVLVAALTSVLYAAAVSLALPEQWEVARYDVTLAALWVAIALGTPVAIAGALFLLVADALWAVAESVWMPPHRVYFTVITGATLSVSGLITIGIGALAAADLGAAALALVTTLAILALALVHVGRRLNMATVPLGLDAASATFAFLATLLLALLLALPIYQGVTIVLGRPFDAAVAGAALFVPAIAAIATLLVVVARSIRPFIPDLAPVGQRLRQLIAVADPVPAGLAVFATLDLIASRTSDMFASLERRGGVWLATGLIVVLLVWSVR